MKKRIVMGIVLAKYPAHSAGHQLSLLHWLLGFRDLGWDVWIVENLASAACVDGQRGPCAPEKSVNVAVWRRFVSAHGFQSRETLFIDGKSDGQGELAEFASGADVFLNYAGQFDVWEAVEEVQRRVYLDVDPGYTQVWALGYGCDMHLDEHDFHVTIRSAWNEDGCRIPDTGHDWIGTVPPVSLSFYRSWKIEKFLRRPAGPWSTVTHWYGAAPVEFGGLSLRGKRESFFLLKDLPALAKRTFRLATDMRESWDDYPVFTAAGWNFERVESVCASMNSFFDFVCGSAGEIGVAKEGYVTSRSGWLSERSLAYLACGLPVVAQDTGWSRIVGEFAGLRAFDDDKGAAKAIWQIEENYPEACRSAFEVAERVFDAKKVIGNVLKRLDVGSSSRKFVRSALPILVPAAQRGAA